MMRAPRNYQIFALDDHLDRLYDSVRLAGIEIPMPLDELILPGPARKHLIAAAKRLGIGVHDAASMEPRGAASFPLSTVSAWMLNGKASRRFCAHRCDAVVRRALLRSSFSVRLTLGRL